MSERSTDWNAYVAETARMLGIPLDEARRAAVAGQLVRLAGPAAELMAFALDETVEPASTYEPEPRQP